MFKSAVEFPDGTDDIWTAAFHCYICEEVHTRMIVYCENGHFVCQKCLSATTKCRCHKKITKVRVEFLENIVRASKFHCEYECGISLTNEEHSFHLEEACRFRPIQCPLDLQVIEYKQYLRHLKRVHNVGTFNLEEDGEASILISNDTEPMYITTFQDKTFFLRWARESSKFWVQSFEACRGISVQIESTTFRCGLRISKAHTGLNSPEIDVVRLVMNERVKLKFLVSPDAAELSSLSSSNRTSSVPTEEDSSNRMSALSMSSSSSEGVSAQLVVSGRGPMLEMEGGPPLPNSSPPPPKSTPKTNAFFLTF